MTPPDENGNWRDLHIPAHITDLIFQKRVSMKEASLLSIIESLCTKGRGCYASTKWLSQAAGLKQSQTYALLKSLRDKELLFKVSRGRNKHEYETQMTQLQKKIHKSLMKKIPDENMSQIPDIRNFLHDTQFLLYNTITPSRPPTAVDERGEVDVPFFPETKNTKHQPTDQDFQFTIQLREAIVQKKKITKAYSKKAWAKEFCTLTKEVGGDLDRIEEVLSWYCEHIGKPYVPQAFSASGFRKKFLQLEEASKRNKPIEYLKPEHLKGDALKIFNTLKNYHWPKGSKDQLPNVIVDSLDAVTVSRQKMIEFMEDKSNKEADVEAMKHLFCHTLQRPVGFLTVWFEEVFRRIIKWEDWSGKLDSYVYEANGKQFYKVFHKLMAEYTSSPNFYWKRFKDKI